MKSFLTPIAVMVLAALAAIGVWHLVGGAMGEQLMSHCPGTQGVPACMMTLSEHLGAWQMLFTAVVTLAFVLLAAVVSRAARGRVRADGPPHSSPAAFAFFVPAPAVPAGDGVSRALIRGIIHPKLFAFAPQ